MTLRNKDGSVYKLSGPNPIMKSQEIWDKYVIHNMEWQPEKSEDKTQVNPFESNYQVRDTFLSELDKAKPEIKIVETKSEIKNTEVKSEATFERTAVVHPDTQEKEEVDDQIEKIFIHVLPAKIKKKTDSLYGDSYQTIQYGNPTSFEGVMLRQEDLVIEVWTDVSTINTGSILYPKTNFKRWWRVQEKTQKAGGWILLASPSDYQPSFGL
jgi:hypothetical protein